MNKVLGAEIEKKIEELIFYKKKYNLEYIVFTLGNTRVIDDRNYYFTPFRKGVNFISAGIVVFSESEGRSILEVIDGRVDIIYVDCEKKSKNSSIEGLFNLERLSHEIIKKSKLRFYKGNDLTTDSVDNLVLNILSKQNRLVGGSNILIVGMGNLGFKVCLKLVERGANVYVLSKRVKKAKQLLNAINTVKPKETISKVTYLNDELISTLNPKIDVIILTHLSTIENNNSIYFNTSIGCNFIDVGKGCLTEEQTNFLIERGNVCMRLDIGDFLIDFITNDIKFLTFNFELPKSKMINGKRILTKGLIGKNGDIVVDSIENPTFVYGICDGKGGFRTNQTEEEKIFIDLITKPNE